MFDSVFQKLWFKVAASVVGVLILVAIASPFIAEIIVLRMIEARGGAWTAVERDGYSWRFKELVIGPAAADTARLVLKMRPELQLRKATVDLRAVLDGPITPTALPPDWLYIAVDPLSLMWDERVIASGVRGRISKGRVVATGPTLSIKGTVASPLRLQVKGDVKRSALQISGTLDLLSAAELKLDAQDIKLRFDGPKIGSVPLQLVDISGAFNGTTERLSGSFKFAKASGDLAVECATQSAERCVLSVKMADVAFADVIEQMRELASPLTKVKASGRIGGEANFDLRAGKLKLSLDGRKLRASGTKIDAARFINGDFGHYVLSARGKRIERISGENAPGWVVASELAPATLTAVAAALDPRLGRHAGYDMKMTSSHLEALFNDAETEPYPGTMAQGVAMRVRRKSELPSLSRELVALVQALELKQEIGEERVLELLINVAEWGPDVIGIGPAAQYYFEKEATDLEPREAAFLGLVAALPMQRHQDWFKSGRPDRAQMETILRATVAAGSLDQSELSSALGSPFFWER
jgi:hypothetical protein